MGDNEKKDTSIVPGGTFGSFTASEQASMQHEKFVTDFIDGMSEKTINIKNIPQDVLKRVLSDASRFEFIENENRAEIKNQIVKDDFSKKIINLAREQGFFDSNSANVNQKKLRRTVARIKRGEGLNNQKAYEKAFRKLVEKQKLTKEQKNAIKQKSRKGTYKMSYDSIRLLMALGILATPSILKLTGNIVKKGTSIMASALDYVVSKKKDPPEEEEWDDLEKGNEEKENEEKKGGDIEQGGNPGEPDDPDDGGGDGGDDDGGDDPIFNQKTDWLKFLAKIAVSIVGANTAKYLMDLKNRKKLTTDDVNNLNNIFKKFNATQREEFKELIEKEKGTLEKHLFGHSFVGPGTSIIDRIKNLNINSLPVSPLDNIAFLHDMFYLSKDPKVRQMADKSFMEMSKKYIGNAEVDLARSLINMKMNIEPWFDMNRFGDLSGSKEYEGTATKEDINKIFKIHQDYNNIFKSVGVNIGDTQEGGVVFNSSDFKDFKNKDEINKKIKNIQDDLINVLNSNHVGNKKISNNINNNMTKTSEANAKGEEILEKVRGGETLSDSDIDFMQDSVKIMRKNLFYDIGIALKMDIPKKHTRQGIVNGLSKFVKKKDTMDATATDAPTTEEPATSTEAPTASTEAPETDKKTNENLSGEGLENAIRSLIKVISIDTTGLASDGKDHIQGIQETVSTFDALGFSQENPGSKSAIDEIKASASEQKKSDENFALDNAVPVSMWRAFDNSFNQDVLLKKKIKYGGRLNNGVLRINSRPPSSSRYVGKKLILRNQLYNRAEYIPKFLTARPRPLEITNQQIQSRTDYFNNPLYNPLGAKWRNPSTAVIDVGA
jgi:hypothetical protein